MDENRLAPYASGAIAIAGLLAEAIGPVGSVLLGTADYAAGASLLFLAEPHAFAASAAWFAGTAIGGVSAPTYVAIVLTLAYRPPLLLLGARHLGLHSRWLWSLWLIALLPVRAAGWISVILAALLAAKALGGRQLLLGLAFGATAATWSFGAMGQKNTDLLTLATDASVILIAVACLVESGRTAAAHRIREVVIDIGPSAEPTLALIDQLRRRLADPDLRVLFRTGGLGWINESGQPGAIPPDAQVTYSATTDGVQAAFVHSQPPTSTAEAEVALAAATAASIAMASVRLELEVRARAAAVSASRARLLSVAADERRALERRLRRGPLARIGKI
ncbi:MAG: ATP-binding protein, partial [Glaciihabitans sp.]|nr:ATP-binding protein [Glaciihabitans sp.]